MADVIFIDTSIVLCILDVPGKNQGREPIFEEFVAIATAVGNTLLPPVATTVETGNHIAQLADGGIRRDILGKSASATAPWVIGKADWSRTFVQNLVTGLPEIHIGSLIELATQGVGVGDASILHEAQVYRTSTSTPSGQNVRIWSLDAGLSALA